MNTLTFISIQGLKLIGSLVVPYVVRLFTPLGIFESFQLTCLMFLVLSAVEQLIVMRHLQALRTSEHRIWSEKAGFNALLTSIRTDYQNVMIETEGEDPDLVRQLIVQRVQKLRDDVHTASEKKELFVADNHAVDTTKVTDLFRQHKARTFREVFRVVDGKTIFRDDEYGRAYFQQIFDLTQSGDIEAVKALLVVEPTDNGSLDKASQLLSFYKVTSSFEARVISVAGFNKMRHNCELEPFEDFGIYGDILLFCTLGYEPHSHGTYSYDSIKIKKYSDFFEACWNTPHTIKMPAVTRNLSLQDVWTL